MAVAGDPAFERYARARPNAGEQRMTSARHGIPFLDGYPQFGGYDTVKLSAPCPASSSAP
jgi:hypothetical protein